MQNFIRLVALSACVTSTLAQAITFSNTTFTGPATIGQVFSVFFSRGNGNPVSILFGNTTYSFQVVGKLQHQSVGLFVLSDWDCRWSRCSQQIRLPRRSPSQRGAGSIPDVAVSSRSHSSLLTCLSAGYSTCHVECHY